jgi:NADPH2:quinone reductase
VLVRVRASSVNGFDVAVAGGYAQGMTGHRFPVVLGPDFAGTVEATGPAVRSLRPGDAVFGVVAKDVLGDGSFGEYVPASEARTARILDGLDLATAGALGLAGTVARRHRHGHPAARSGCAHLGLHRRCRGVAGQLAAARGA